MAVKQPMKGEIERISWVCLVQIDAKNDVYRRGREGFQKSCIYFDFSTVLDIS
jgi:hypothetical protein